VLVDALTCGDRRGLHVNHDRAGSLSTAPLQAHNHQPSRESHVSTTSRPGRAAASLLVSVFGLYYTKIVTNHALASSPIAHHYIVANDAPPCW
jgi:hypothetical protein